MNEKVREELLRTLASLGNLFPDWQFGELIANVAAAVRLPKRQTVWDCQDDELLAAAQRLVKGNQTPPTSGLRSGHVTAFLRGNLFTVELGNGVAITAVMPDELLPIYDPNVPLTRFCTMSVQVEMREPPALPKIVRAWPAKMVCGGD